MNKTISDAHKELKGDLANTFDARQDDLYLYWGVINKEYICLSHKVYGVSREYICTVEEFNNYKPEVKPVAPVFTQKMCDEGVLPSVGMMVLDKRNNNEYKVLQPADINGYYVLLGGDGGYHCELLKYLIPIDTRTDADKAVEDLDKIITDAYQDATDSYISNSRFHAEAVRLLDEIKGGNIHGITFKPLTVEE